MPVVQASEQAYVEGQIASRRQHRGFICKMKRQKIDNCSFHAGLCMVHIFTMNVSLSVLSISGFWLGFGILMATANKMDS